MGAFWAGFCHFCGSVIVLACPGARRVHWKPRKVEKQGGAECICPPQESEEPLFIPAQGFERFSSKAGILLEVLFTPPKRFSHEQAIRLSLKDHARIWKVHSATPCHKWVFTDIKIGGVGGEVWWNCCLFLFTANLPSKQERASAFLACHRPPRWQDTPGH